MSPRFRVVLAAPENPLNVGLVARAMKCFGAEELFIAGSAWREMPEKARATGARAPEILDAARLVPTLAQALRGCSAAVAFSRRPTTLRQHELVLPAAPSFEGRVALVFGRESSGLTLEESALCPYLARIPCREGLSLNLGQAAAIALFSLSGRPPAPPRAPRRPPPATVDRLLDLWDFLEPRLAAAPRFTTGRLRRIRQLLYRLELDDAELGLLFAVCNELSRPAEERRAARRAG